MRLKDIYHLNEVNMSPGALKVAASRVQALAGMEFELIVPGLDLSDEENSDYEFDYGYDRDAMSIDDIVSFFANESAERPLSGYDTRQLRSDLYNSFYEFLEEDFSRSWSDNGFEYLTEQLEKTHWELEKYRRIYDEFDENIPEDEAMILIKNHLSGKESSEIVNDAYQKARSNFEHEIDIIWTKKKWPYEEIQESFKEEFWINPTEEDWIDGRNMATFADVYSISWPYIFSLPNNTEKLEEIAYSFEEAIGRRVDIGAIYHTIPRRPGRYVLEPDGSLEGDVNSDSGVEFVSPPLPVTEIIEDLKDVKNWAKKYGCYTNTSCGLHMNVSVPNYNLENLDYTKLILFVGDSYILEKYNRSVNVYARNSFNMLQDRAKNYSFTTDSLLKKMRDDFNHAASKVLFDGETDKYMSVNTHTNYVEFRSPGGDWLNIDLDELEATLYRFIVALDIACDPNKYKKEYAKKIYTMLSNVTTPRNSDTVQLFADWKAGNLSYKSLKYSLQTIQKNREINRQFTTNQKKTTSADERTGTTVMNAYRDYVQNHGKQPQPGDSTIIGN